MATETSPVRVCIGSGEASLVERKVLIHTLRKHTDRPLDIYVYNGTHNAIEKNDEPPVPAPLSLRVKYRSFTEFSMFRYIIPEICGREGRAIYLDSDTICLSDIGELFDTPLDGADFLSKPDAYGHRGEKQWGTSVMLLDCARCSWDLDEIIDEVDRGLYGYDEFLAVGPKFLEHHPFTVGELPPHWNDFDRCESETNLVHFTDLFRQPWKAYDHPCGELWFRYFHEALEAGVLTREDVEKSRMRSYVRYDLWKGNRSPAWWRRLRRPKRRG